MIWKVLAERPKVVLHAFSRAIARPPKIVRLKARSERRQRAIGSGFAGHAPDTPTGKKPEEGVSTLRGPFLFF